MNRVLIWVAVVAAALAGCSVLRGTPAPDVRLVAVGDSILAWNRSSNNDIPELVSQATGLPVFNAAISGAKFIGRFEVPAQYPAGDWDWVLMDGGGNDLTGNCDTPQAADAVLDRLIDDETLGGAYATFLNRVTAQGTQVIIMGYAPISIAGGGFAPCEAALNDLMARQARLADTSAAVTFVDVRDVIAPENLAAYDNDLIHPSLLGGALMAQHVAAAINARR